jgi:flagella basal body P-ring formation protein FlgA
MFVARLPVLALLACAIASVAPIASAAPVTLRAAPIASGNAVTLGDLFENAGAAASEPIAPAPAPGQTAPLSARFVAAAAQAAGLDWSPPTGLERIIIGRLSPRAAAARAVSIGAANAPEAPSAASTSANAAAPAAAIRRGEPVTVVIEQPGLRLALQGRALNDARVGETIRVQNVQSSRTIDAIATGPGSAQVRPAS